VKRWPARVPPSTGVSEIKIATRTANLRLAVEDTQPSSIVRSKARELGHLDDWELSHVSIRSFRTARS
jgi:hypothetical protein